MRTARPSAWAIVADLATVSSRELTAHAEGLEDLRDELQALADELDKSIGEALFAGESADDLKKELAATQEALSDVERAILGSEPAIAAARAVEADARRRESVKAFNAALARTRGHVKRLVEATAAIPTAAQAAMAAADEARALAAELAADGMTVRPPAEPGRFVKDLLSNASAAAYGYQGGAGLSRAARARLEGLCDGLDLPEDE